MPLTVSDITRNADAFRRAYPSWPHPEPTEGDTAQCRSCSQRIALLGGDWTDPDGCTNCLADLSALYAPHEPGVMRMRPDEPLADPVGADMEPGDFYGPGEG